ncbi:MAG: biopolymer transporter ExbD [Paracoccaceae bacterium]|nr:MAG: biopolymer transporter ExbD [Paracoccaceae bacterium]
MPRPMLLPPPRRRAADFSLAIVNIVLLLVFFFVITGSLVQRGETRVDLARTSELPLERLPRPLLLIDAQGGMAVDGVEVTADTLAAALSDPPPPALHVLADATLPAEVLLRLTMRPDLAPVALRLVTLHDAAFGAAP